MKIETKYEIGDEVFTIDKASNCIFVCEIKQITVNIYNDDFTGHKSDVIYTLSMKSQLQPRDYLETGVYVSIEDAMKALRT